MLVKALARAWRWQRLLDRGVYGSVTEIAEAERISKSYVSRILRLALLAPDIVEAILGGWADQRVIREIMLFLHGHGVGISRAVRIFKTYGADAVQVITENPYQLRATSAASASGAPTRSRLGLESRRRR